MAFSCYFETTPPKRRDTLDDDEIPVLIFRPFGNAPKLIFKNVLVGDKATKQLLLQNPQDEILEVELLKLPPIETGVKFSSKKFQIYPLQNTTLIVEWQPAKEGKFIYTIPLKSNTNGRFNFSLVCTSIQKKALKKNSKSIVKTASTNRRVVLKSNSSQSSFKNNPSVVQKSLTVRKETLPSKPKFSSKKISFSSTVTKSCERTSAEGKLIPKSVLNIERIQVEGEDKTAMEEEDLRNCSSETYVVSPGSVTASVDIKESTQNSRCSLISTQTHCTTKEANLFSDLTFSPIHPSLLGQPREAKCRETFALSTPLKFISEVPEISPNRRILHINMNAFEGELGRIDEDSLSPLTDKRTGNEQIRFTSPRNIRSHFADNIHSKFLDFEISPVKQIKTDISGISELDVTNGVSCNRNTLEISLPSFTPLQISKQDFLLSSFDTSLREIKNGELTLEGCNISEFKTPLSIVQPSQASSRGNNESAFSGSSRTLDRTESFHPLMEKLGNADDLILQQTTSSAIKNVYCEEQEERIEKKIKTCYSFQIQPVNKETKLKSGSVSFCKLHEDQKSASKHLLKQSESNYLVFTPPRKFLRSKKENISPVISENVGSKSNRKPLNKSVTFTRSRDTLKHLTSQTKAKKEVHFALPKLVLASKKRKSEEMTLMDTEKTLAEHANPSYCITATTINPFINSGVFYDLQWFDEREKEFVRWLNMLLTPPAQLNSSDELPTVDVAELWKKCCKSDVAPAPSRETVSSLYLVNHRLDSLRRKACTMFRSPAIAQVLSKVVVQIEKGNLSVRKDRNIVRDIVLKTTIIELLLCYNPLWLRIGLETVMGKTIPLESNSDRVRIVGFIMRNILSDPYLVEQYAYAGVTNMFKPGFEEAMKKHILKKFFLLVYFLDCAKENKLIVHNPCLFCKNAKYKESRDLLLAFARDFLSGVGDITKHLGNLGYVVRHHQTYLDEYSYAVAHLGSDLRDGVRLTKVTEIILQQSTLTSRLRAPAISKLQKVHNVKVALTALNKAGHVIEGDITAKDIVEGHREKTMSLLWQVIYKFQFTRFSTAASKIQSWYRSLYISISRRMWLKKQMMKKRAIESAASKIIQKHWRRYTAQRRYKLFISATCRIQMWYKSVLLMKEQRSKYLKKREAVITIQRFFRRIHKLKEEVVLQEQKIAVNKISAWYYNIKLTRHYEEQYKRMKHSTICIQRWYRASCIMKVLRAQFVFKRESAMCIQKWYRNLKLSRAQRYNFLQQKNAALVIQKWYRLCLLTQKMRHLYLVQKFAAVKIQRWYQACLAMKKERKRYLKIYLAACKIQLFFRAKKQLRNDLKSFKRIRNSVVKIQLWFKSTQLMKLQRTRYLKTQISVKKIQIWYRATKLMKKHQKSFLNQRRAAVVIQQKFRAVKLGHQQRHLYNQQRHAVVLIQLWYRSRIVARLERQRYLRIKNAAITIQRYFKSTLVTRGQRKEFKRQKNAVLKIQKWYQACVAMRKQRVQYIKQQNAACQIQKFFRSKTLMLQHRRAFTQKRIAARRIQLWLRSTIFMKQVRTSYLLICKCTMKIQIWYRATLCMRYQRNIYLKQRYAAIVIQQKFRAVHLSHKQKRIYYLQRQSAIKIQKWFRNIRFTQLQRQQYLEIRNQYRHKEHMIMQNNAAIKIQKWYRVNISAKKQRKEFERQNHILENKKESVKRIEQWYLSILSRRNEAALRIRLEKEEQEAARKAFATKIQAYWRGYYTRKIMKISNTAVDRRPLKKYVLNEKICLRAKYRSAVNVYVSHSDHSYAKLMSASLLLESCIRLSREICEEFLLSSHVDTLIYLIYSTNRSLPAENLSNVLLNILMHILSHPQGVKTILKIGNVISYLVEITNKFCTRRTEELFCQMCSVWWLLGQDEDINEGLKNDKCVSVALKKCHSFITSWNACSSKCTATSVKRQHPYLTPNWCTRRFNRPRTFENGRCAINEVLKKLHIKTS